MSAPLYLSRLWSELRVHVLRCPRSLPSASTCALWEVPLTSPALNTLHILKSSQTVRLWWAIISFLGPHRHFSLDVNTRPARGGGLLGACRFLNRRGVLRHQRRSPARVCYIHTQQCAPSSSPLQTICGCVFGKMDVRSVEEWSKGARRVAALEAQQQSPGGEQHLEESHFLPGLALVDSGSDPRAWLALVQPPGTCAAHATSSEYLQHSPCPSTGSYHGEQFR